MSFAIEKTEADTATGFAQYKAVTSEAKNGTTCLGSFHSIHWSKLKSPFSRLWSLQDSRTIIT